MKRHLSFLLILLSLIAAPACSSDDSLPDAAQASSDLPAAPSAPSAPEAPSSPAASESDACGTPPQTLIFNELPYRLKQENTAVEPGMKLGWLLCTNGGYTPTQTDGGPGIVTVRSAGNPKDSGDIIVFGEWGRALYAKATDSVILEPATQAADFALRINDQLIPLRTPEAKARLEEAIGKPQSQETIKLTDGADTLTGSYIKTLHYPGLDIEMFAAKDTPESFWIMTMTVTEKGYETAQGIEIGDKVQDIKTAYPAITMAPDGRTDPDNCAYQIRDESQYNYLDIEVAEGRVIGIKIYHLIP